MTTTTHPPEEAAGNTNRWLALTGLSIWFILCALLIYPFAWIVEQFFLIAGEQWPSLAWPLIAIGHSLLVSIPALLLLRFWPGEDGRALFEAFALAGLFVLTLAPMRLAGYTAALLASALQIVCTLVFIVVIWALLRRRAMSRTQSLAWRKEPLWRALLLVPFLVAGWIAWGAAGSWLDTILNLLAALLLGIASGLILTGYLLPTLYREAEQRPLVWFLGGLAAGAILLTMGAAFGANGQQLILMPALGALGWAAVGLAGWDRGADASLNWQVPALLVGLAAAAPLIFIDPDELALVLNLGTQDVGAWAIYATGVTVLVAWVIGVLVIAFRRWLSRWEGNAVTSGLVIAAWLAVVGLFFFVGQPGFHGERLFVILNDQADVSAAADMTDYPARRWFVYDTLSAHADATQAGLRATLDRLRLPYTSYYLVNALEVDGGPLLRWWLERRPEVERVLDSPIMRPLPLLPEAGGGSQTAPASPAWNLTGIGAPEVWETYSNTGTGIVVGQSDSGVDGGHPELNAAYRGRQQGSDAYNWFDPWYGTAAPRDISGHGTHTLGVAVGQTVGVAPGATWIGCVNLARNLGNPALYLDCLQFMLAPFPHDGDPLRDGRPELGAHVLNNSWGCPPIEGCDAQALLYAVRALRDAGVFVVASAGNEGADCGSVSDPIAIYDAVFSVGAVNELGHVAPFSSRGPVLVDGSGRIKPDLVAPGVGILSAAPGGGYSLGSGTSDAGPHVAGAVALIWSANPALIGDIERTEQILAETARPYDETMNGPLPCSDGGTPNNTVGYGLLDALAAVEMAINR
jgi:subtilisin family serine protease